MQANLNEAQRAFQREVQTFLRDKLPQETADAVRLTQPLSKQAMAHWIGALNTKGWAAPNWPKEHGGTGWSLMERHIFDVECRLAHAPALPGFGFNMVGPAIIRFGTPEQQQEHLPRILDGSRAWCQGYSEPGAGSDLAGLQTRADDDGDQYRITGRKIWTSAAEVADWIFVLVRTDQDAKAQEGISFVLIDMNTPGITVEPLMAFNGKRLWNQVIFEEVAVPKANRLGKENRGWTVAKRLLGDERLMVSRVAENKRVLSIVRAELARADTQTLPASLLYRADEIDIRLRALESSSLRLLSAADLGETIGAEPSMLKLKGSQLVQAQDELLFELAGYWAAPQDRSNRNSTSALTPMLPEFAEYTASATYHHRGYTIAGGASEVQYNIIAKQVLGL